MRIFNFVRKTLVEGPGLRDCVWLQGCLSKCPGCFNKQTHDINGGYEIRIPDLISAIKSDAEGSNKITGLTIAGGEPFLQPEVLYAFISALRSEIKNINIMLYSGYELSYIKKIGMFSTIASMCDILISGPFVQSKSPDDRKWIGSANQEISFYDNALKTKLTPWPTGKDSTEIEIRPDGEISICGNALPLGGIIA